MGKFIAFAFGFILGSIFGTAVGQFLWNKLNELVTRVILNRMGM